MPSLLNCIIGLGAGVASGVATASGAGVASGASLGVAVVADASGASLGFGLFSASVAVSSCCPRSSTR